MDKRKSYDILKKEGINMTKMEYKKCEKLMEEAINKAHKSRDDFNKAERYLQDGDEAAHKEFQRKGDQLYGYSVAINQVLVSLRFKHARMKELSDLL